MLHPTPETFTAHPASQWTGAVKARFLECLAQKGNARLAARHVGLSAETAYRQRRRDPVFARGWDAAMALARRVSEQVLADRAIDGIEVEIWHRGELAGTTRRYDTRLLLAHLARLDRQVEANPAAEADAERFDELLVVIAGADLPAEHAGDDSLPPARDAFVAQAVEAAVAGLADREPVDDWRDFGRHREPEELEQREREEQAFEAACEEAAQQAEAQAGRQWDDWRRHAHAAVDAVLAAPAEDPPVGATEPGTEGTPDISPRTVSTPSTPPPVEIEAPGEKSPPEPPCTPRFRWDHG